MGTTAEKLTYLSGTKDLLKTTINYTGANITNDTFRSYPEKLKDAYIDIINNGTDTLYGNLPKVSGKGSNLSLTPTYEAPMRSELYGDTLQDGTPTPSSPVEIENVTGLQTITIANGDNTSSNTYEVNLGKNLFNSTIINGVVTNDNINTTSTTRICTQNFIKVQPNTTYTLSFVSSIINNYNVSYFTTNGFPRSSQTNWVNIFNPTFTTPDNINYILITFRKNDDSNVAPSDITNIQLEKGSTATTYSPYFTPIELNKIVDYEDSIKKSTGKNLFNKDNANVLNAYINGNKVIVSENVSKTLYIPCKPNTTYTISKMLSTPTNQNKFRVCTTSDVPTIGTTGIDYVGYNTGTEVTNITITTSSNARYLCVFMITTSTSTTTLDEMLASIQIEVGSTATTYEPYGKVWYLEKNTRKLELAIADMNNNEDYPGWKNQTQLKNDVYNGTYVGTLNYYTNFYNNIEEYNSEEIRTNFNNQEVLFIRKSKYNYTQTQWKTNYPNLVFKMWYGIVNNPEIVEITNTELIEDLENLYNAKSKEGTTNIVVTSEDLSMIINASALKGE